MRAAKAAGRCGPQRPGRHTRRLLLNLTLAVVAAVTTPGQAKTCLLFVGPHKTGSTSLEEQLRTLATERGLLRSLGYEWLEVNPKLGSDRGCKSHAQLPQTLAALTSGRFAHSTTDEALAASPKALAVDRALSAVPKHVVIATENWVKASSATVGVLGEILRSNGFTDVRVVINWRPHAQRSLSALQVVVCAARHGVPRC
eukprot:scaffold884_cov398-Prasinococcus_capsulatus_cf.AAC.2